MVSAIFSFLAAGEQADAADNAAELSARASAQAVAEQRRQFDLGRSDMEPWRLTGQNALTQYAALYGVSGRDTDDNREFLDEQYQTGTEQYLNPAYGAGPPDSTFGNFRSGGSVADTRYWGPGGSIIDTDVPQYLTRPTYGTRQVKNEA